MKLFVLFTIITYTELSIDDTNNVRNFLQENGITKISQKMPMITSPVKLKNPTYTTDFQHTIYQTINNHTAYTERYGTEYTDTDKFNTSPLSYHKSLKEIRWKINLFWTTVIIISVLWMIILIGLIVTVYIRIVYMHHTISQIFCPKD
ncbi:unnamed protein product [Onchocerca flexuosa]|uniref:SLC3A2_N domain-containing protein n=1 Tax=Onchocerca flexuosa TaxID=387005 RepID=A0A183I543_9BILA|nr:unnamed protein product [Onchocerca flexuosa]